MKEVVEELNPVLMRMMLLLLNSHTRSNYPSYFGDAVAEKYNAVVAAMMFVARNCSGVVVLTRNQS
jgi:hypothetical protein